MSGYLMDGWQTECYISEIEKRSMTIKLNSPITEEQWDIISDVDFDATDRIWFHTKHGKDVEFVKVVWCKDCIKHNKGIEDVKYYGDICPLVYIRGKAKGHEFDYQYCAFGIRRQETEDRRQEKGEANELC